MWATLDVGTPKDEVMAALPEGGIAPGDPERELVVILGYWRGRYLIEGRMVEVVWAHDPMLGFPDEDLRSLVTPIVFVDDRLDGWGWRHFNRSREELGIPERPTVPLPVRDRGEFRPCPVNASPANARSVRRELQDRVQHVPDLWKDRFLQLR